MYDTRRQTRGRHSSSTYVYFVRSWANCVSKTFQNAYITKISKVAWQHRTVLKYSFISSYTFLHFTGTHPIKHTCKMIVSILKRQWPLQLLFLWQLRYVRATYKKWRRSSWRIKFLLWVMPPSSIFLN